LLIFPTFLSKNHFVGIVLLENIMGYKQISSSKKCLLENFKIEKIASYSSINQQDVGKFL